MWAESLSILITDDDLSFRESLQDVFENLGFRTLLAADGEQALSMVRAEPVHIVVTDMHMPRLTGLEMIRQVQQFNTKLPCILLSAALSEELVLQAQVAHAFSVLSKPVSRQELTGSVKHALKWAYGWPILAQ